METRSSKKRRKISEGQSPRILSHAIESVTMNTEIEGDL